MTINHKQADPKVRTLIIPPEIFTSKELQQYERQILDNKHVTEHDASHFFEKFPKFLSIGGYKQITREVLLYAPSGEIIYRVDFFRRRYGDEYWDIVELKSPQIPFITKYGKHLKFSNDIEKGIHQAIDYSDFLEEVRNRLEIEKMTGIKAFRPKTLIIGGRNDNNEIDPCDMRKLTSRYIEVDIQSYDDIYNFAKDNYFSNLVAIPIVQSEKLEIPKKLPLSKEKPKIKEKKSKKASNALFSLDKHHNIVIRLVDKNGNTMEEVPPEEYVMKKMEEMIKIIYKR